MKCCSKQNRHLHRLEMLCTVLKVFNQENASRLHVIQKQTGKMTHTFVWHCSSSVLIIIIIVFLQQVMELGMEGIDREQTKGQMNVGIRTHGCCLLAGEIYLHLMARFPTK